MVDYKTTPIQTREIRKPRSKLGTRICILNNVRKPIPITPLMQKTNLNYCNLNRHLDKLKEYFLVDIFPYDKDDRIKNTIMITEKGFMTLKKMEEVAKYVDDLYE